MSDDLLTVATRDHDGVPVVMASGELDVSTVPMLREALDAFPDTTPRIIIDLENISFLDSTALGALVYTLKRLRESDEHGSVVLVITHPHVLKVLEVTGLDKVFSISQRVADAANLS